MMAGFNYFVQIANSIKPAVRDVVKKTAFDGKANIQGQIRANGQIDTGFMVNGVYVVTSEGSTYSGGDKALPEVAGPSDESSAFIASAAEYSVYQNYGTSRIPARPFWEPGIEKTRPSFEAAIAAIESKMAEAAS